MARYTKAQIKESLTKSDGIIQNAARALGCHRSTVYEFVKKYPDVKRILDDEREATIDKVESQLLKQISEGNTTATIFFLKTLGRGRGYVERQEIEISDWRSKLIQALKDGLIKPEEVTERLGDKLAAEIFKGAGINVS
jgi:transposase-like protein